VGDVDIRDHACEGALQLGVARFGIAGLPGFVILAAEDDNVVVLVTVETQVMIRVGCVPEEGVGNGAARDTPCYDVCRIEKQFRLKQRRAHDVRFAHQRRVRGHDDVVASDRVSACFDRKRVVHNLL